MFQFLNPIWLFGAAAIAIPVLIHLWNIRSGKVLKVGSVSLISAASRQSSRSFKLLDVPLFILRCLLLILLALLLALPVWQKKMQAAKVKGWILVPKENFTATYQKFKPAIDSLTKAGYEFHYFNKGFAKSNLKQILLNQKDSLKTQIPAPQTLQPNYWNLVRQLNSKIASTLPVHLFTPNQAVYFTGNKPQVALNLHWQTYLPADSVSSFIQDAWITNNGDIRVVQGTGKPSGTTYTYSNVRPNEGNAAYNISTSNGALQIALPNSKLQPINVDTATQSIIIYADNYTVDAGYLKAALQAVGQFTQRKFSLKTVSNPASVPAQTDWLFWLSEKPVSQSLLSRCQNILAYQKGKTTTVNGIMNNGGQFSTALANDDQVKLFKSVTTTGNVEPVWQDGFGKPVLSKEQSGTAHLYKFHSRFNPSWNDLVWSDAFPAWLLKLIMEPAKTNTAGYDRRVLSAQQYLPAILTETRTVTSEKPMESKSLARYFWLLLMVIFLAERLLAHRTPKTNMA